MTSRRATTASPGEPQLTVAVRTAGQITSRMLSMKPTVLYVPLSELAEHPDLRQRVGVETQLAAILPRVIWSGELAPVARQLRTVYEMGVRQVLAGNLGQLHIARAAGFAVRGDFGLNIVNSRAMRYLREQGLDSQLLSFELTLPQIRDISKAVPAEVLIYGRLPLMLMENCVIKNRTGTCACQTGTVRLVDRVGEEFPIVKDPGTCRNVLLNGKKLYLLDKKDALPRHGPVGAAPAVHNGKPRRDRQGADGLSGPGRLRRRKLYARTVFARRGISKKEGTSYDHPCIAISPQARADEAHRPAVYRSCRGYRRDDGSGAARPSRRSRASAAGRRRPSPPARRRTISSSPPTPSWSLTGASWESRARRKKRSACSACSPAGRTRS